MEKMCGWAAGMVMVRPPAVKIITLLGLVADEPPLVGNLWHNSEEPQEVEAWFGGWSVTT
jgi:hypothetical protein